MLRQTHLQRPLLLRIDQGAEQFHRRGVLVLARFLGQVDKGHAMSINLSNDAQPHQEQSPKTFA